MIFRLLLVSAALPFGVGLFFQLRSVLDFFFPALRKTHRWMRFVFPALLSAAALCLSAFFWLDGLIWIAYALVLSGLIEIAARLVRRILRDKRPFKDGPERMIRVFGRIWRTRLLPFALSALCLLLGAVNLSVIRTTDYELTGRSAASRSLAKLPGQELTVYVLSDIHYDTIQSTEAVKAYLKEIDEDRPDLLLLVGDLTDESTPRDSMFELFSEIGSVRTTYGIFSVDGNHDRQTYAPAGSRSFTSEEYSEAMKANGITLLSDECFESDAFRIIGRKDASTRSRSAGNLILTEEQRADPKYTILLDHQPNSGSPEDWADADLVLCGHTHGGQIFPAGLLLELVGYNAGLYREDGYDVIVSSGVAGWGFHTKTQSRAEGVCIKIRPAPEDNSELNG